MKSPITAKEMSLQKETRMLSFRKEEFEVVFHFYLCEGSGEQFTSSELDEINLQQLYNQYRDKHNLPFPEQVRETREQYGLSATKMSEVLGFGVNSYRNYENDEVPSAANGKLIQMAGDPVQFGHLVKLSELLEVDFKNKLLNKIAILIQEQNNKHFSLQLENYFLDVQLPDEFSGYRKPSLKKLTEMIVYFTEKMKPWKTQMNKLLFYADFINFKKECFSMSGTRYRAIEMGPVPYNYDSIFEYLCNKDEIAISYTEFPNGAIGEQFMPNKKRKIDLSLFNSNEVAILEMVVDKFKIVTTKQIVEFSHMEKGWLENNIDRKLISYKYAFDLVDF